MAAGYHSGGTTLDGTVFEINMGADGKYRIGDSGIPGDIRVSGNVRAGIDMPEASAVAVPSGCLAVYCRSSCDIGVEIHSFAAPSGRRSKHDRVFLISGKRSRT